MTTTEAAVALLRRIVETWITALGEPPNEDGKQPDEITGAACTCCGAHALFGPGERIAELFHAPDCLAAEAERLLEMID